MFELKIETDFSAAHQLAMVGKKCENLHGHNWKVEVAVAGDHLDEGGVLIDFGILKQHVRETVGLLDHTFLNDLEYFDDRRPPSSENIARFIAMQLQPRIDSDRVRVARVTAWESKDACATYLC